MNRILAAAAIFAMTGAPLAFAADNMNSSSGTGSAGVNASGTGRMGSSNAQLDTSANPCVSANPGSAACASGDAKVNGNASGEGGGVQNPKTGTGVNGAVGTGVGIGGGVAPTR
jgi:hypothetical protein